MSPPFIDLKKLPTWALSNEMRLVCQPIFKKFNINYIDYCLFYPDGRVASLYTDLNYAQYFLNDEVFYTAPPPKALTPGLHLWAEYIDLDFLANVSKNFNHTNGITITRQMNDHVEIVNIAVPSGNQKILGLYLNQQSLIQELISHLRKITRKLIQETLDNPLIIPTAAFSKPSKKAYPRTIKINNVSIPLTPREADCLYFMIEGKTAKEIGKILSLSNRTVEIYIAQLRSKTGAKNRLALLHKINRHDLEEFMGEHTLLGNSN